MRAFVRSPFVAAFIGGAVVAVTLVAFGVSAPTRTTTVVQQSPVAATAPGGGSGGSSGDDGLTAHAIYEQAAPGVVFVRARVSQQSSSPFGFGQQSQQGVATGSGFVIDRDGYILTNDHVVQGASEVTVGFDNKQTVKARIVGTDPNNDLALLRVNPSATKLTPIALGDSSTAQVGDTVLAIGNPFGLDRTLTTGVVSALQRQIQAPNGFSILHVIQTDAPINPGNSGGPLLDAGGRVIGINSQIETGGSGGGNVGIGFSVPINTAKTLLPQLKSGDVSHAWLGITGATIDSTLAQLHLPVHKGVLVQSVVSGGPAEKAGLKGGTIQSEIDGQQVALGGDVIQALDGKPVTSIDDLVTALGIDRPGQKVTLTILRGKASKKLTVTLQRTPKQAPGAVQQSQQNGPQGP